MAVLKKEQIQNAGDADMAVEAAKAEIIAGWLRFKAGLA